MKTWLTAATLALSLTLAHAAGYLMRILRHDALCVADANAGCYESLAAAFRAASAGGIAVTGTSGMTASRRDSITAVVGTADEAMDLQQPQHHSHQPRVRIARTHDLFFCQARLAHPNRLEGVFDAGRNGDLFCHFLRDERGLRALAACCGRVGVGHSPIAVIVGMSSRPNPIKKTAMRCCSLVGSAAVWQCVCKRGSDAKIC